MRAVFKGVIAATLLAGSSVAATAPVEAHDRTGTALLAGVIGLGIGAAIASSNDHREYSDGYYGNGYSSGYYAPTPVYYDNGYGYAGGYGYTGGYGYRQDYGRGYRDHDRYDRDRRDDRRHDRDHDRWDRR